jgi:hypothetical protein
MVMDASAAGETTRKETGAADLSPPSPLPLPLESPLLESLGLLECPSWAFPLGPDGEGVVAAVGGKPKDFTLTNGRTVCLPILPLPTITNLLSDGIPATTTCKRAGPGGNFVGEGSC